MICRLIPPQIHTRTRFKKMIFQIVPKGFKNHNKEGSHLRERKVCCYHSLSHFGCFLLQQKLHEQLNVAATKPFQILKPITQLGPFKFFPVADKDDYDRYVISILVSYVLKILLNTFFASSTKKSQVIFYSSQHFFTRITAGKYPPGYSREASRPTQQCVLCIKSTTFTASTALSVPCWVRQSKPYAAAFVLFWCLRKRSQ